MLPLEAGPVVLRRWRETDTEAVVREADSRAVWRNLTHVFPHPYTGDAAREWIAHCQGQEPASDLAITLDDLVKYSAGVQLVVLPSENVDHFSAGLRRLTRALPTLKHIAASYLYRGDDRARINRLDTLARANGLSILATNDVHYHAPERRPLQDVMTCILHKTTIHKAGYLLDANAERHLKSPAAKVHSHFVKPKGI